MPTSVRLDPQTEAELERIARVKELSKSDVIREAIHAYGAELVPTTATSLLDSWRDAIGTAASERGDLTTNSREKILAKVRERHLIQPPRRATGPKQPRK
ncbi:MAG: ribbon-helix-helix protein, CopG family [Thermoanaerobaculia bacterium]